MWPECYLALPHLYVSLAEVLLQCLWCSLFYEDKVWCSLCVRVCACSPITSAVCHGARACTHIGLAETSSG